MLTEIIKGLGAARSWSRPNTDRALRTAAELEPGIIFTERTATSWTARPVARNVRRSHLGCRRVPIIMVTAEATATTILGARDAGVHEFLRKPFTSGDLLKRVENVALKPRDWVEAVGYVGPDRRRFNSGEFSGPGKRKADKPATGRRGRIAAAKDQAMRILASALDQFDRIRRRPSAPSGNRRRS
jgi:DNA-binding response OmpR family regulator